MAVFQCYLDSILDSKSHCIIIIVVIIIIIFRFIHLISSHAITKMYYTFIYL